MSLLRRTLAGATVVLLGAAGVIAVASPASAAVENYDVTLPGDDGSVGTLRWAIEQANAHTNDGAPDSISIAAGLTVTAENPLDGTLQLLNTTVDELVADDSAVWVEEIFIPGMLEILSSTLSSDGVVLAVGHQEGGSRIVNSIFAARPGDPAITLGSGFPLGVRHSLLSSAAVPTVISDPSEVTANVANMGLAPLADNGGPTFTRMPLETSPARDAGDSSAFYVATTPYDQRGDGYPRLLGGLIDIGAVEVPPRTLPSTGAEVAPVLPLVAALGLLVAGAAGVVVVRMRRSRARA